MGEVGVAGNAQLVDAGITRTDSSRRCSVRYERDSQPEPKK